MDDYIHAEQVTECVSDAKIKTVVDEAMVKIRDRLDAEMPDEIGIIWKVIADMVCNKVELFLADRLEPGVREIIDDAVMRAGAEGEEPRLTDLLYLGDANGREFGTMLSEECHITRVDFLRGFLDGLSKDALDDLQAEILRR